MMFNQRLFWLYGASDSRVYNVMQHTRKKIYQKCKVVFAYRFVTKHPDLDDENHIFLSQPEFQQHVENGLFSINWSDANYQYAIGSEVQSWLNKGIGVVAHGSSACLSQVKRIFRNVVPVFIKQGYFDNMSRFQSQFSIRETELLNEFYRSPDFKRSDIQVIDADLDDLGAADNLLDIILQHQIVAA